MTTCLGKSCSFCLLCVPSVNAYQFVCVCVSYPFGFEGGNVLVPDLCLSFYFNGA